MCKGKSVCAGISEILRNILAARGIECNYVGGNTHAFNQVKIDGKWYYMDLTSELDNFMNGDELSCTLVSERELRYNSEGQHYVLYMTAMPQDYEEATESYDKEKLRATQLKVHSEIIGRKAQKSEDFENEVPKERIADGILSQTAMAIAKNERSTDKDEQNK